MLEGAARRSDLVPFFFRDGGGQPFARARSSVEALNSACGPHLWLSDAGKSEAQPPGALPSPGAACAGGAPTRPRPRARAVRPARGNPWGRSGRLHAPEAARTGPVNALRRSRTYNSQRGGSGSTEIWPLTNFWSGSIDIGLRWSLIPSYNRQNALTRWSFMGYLYSILVLR